MKIILIVILTFFLTACGKSKVEIIALNPNIQSSITKTEKIWDVFDRKINILIIDDRKNKFKIKGLEKYQKDKIIYLEDGKMVCSKKNSRCNRTDLAVSILFKIPR